MSIDITGIFIGLDNRLRKRHICDNIFNYLTENCSVANTKQAKKRARQNIKNRSRNASLRSVYRTHIKKVLTAVAAKNKADADTAYKAMVSMLDKMVAKGIIHKNKAARHKSRLVLKIKGL
jgi:small subunit ribosomal protein S20